MHRWVIGAESSLQSHSCCWFCFFLAELLVFSSDLAFLGLWWWLELGLVQSGVRALC